jgi:lipoyl(octanoyl) transferase
LNHIINKTIYYKDLGLIDYKEAWDYQEELHKKIVDIKLGNREKAESDQSPTYNYLIFCQHPHVFTLGKSGDKSNLLLNEEGLEEKGATFYQINRGGDITYHGPGQIVGYPILDLENFFTDIHKYLRYLEETVILTCRNYGIDAGRISGLTGVWLDYEKQMRPRKICAIGVRSSHWVTMHGFAFNIETDLAYFNNIIPCGISDKAVTSLAAELGRKVDLHEVQTLLKENFTTLFEGSKIEELNEEGHYQV